MIPQTVIGVDPAFRAGGFWACILDFREKTINFQKFENVLEWDRWLRSIHTDTPDLVVVENSNGQNASFDTSGTRRVTARKGRNVGANQAASQLAVQAALDQLGWSSVLSITPYQKGAKITYASTFEAIVKSDGFILPPKYPKNQDCRDAYKIAWIGRNIEKMRS